MWNCIRGFFALQVCYGLWPELCWKWKRWEHWKAKRGGRLGSSTPAPNILMDTEPSRQSLGTLRSPSKMGERNTSQSWHQGPWDKIHTQLSGSGSLLRIVKLSCRQSVSCQQHRFQAGNLTCTGCLERGCKMCLTCVAWAQCHLLEPWGPMHSSACQWTTCFSKPIYSLCCILLASICEQFGFLFLKPGLLF